MAARIERLVPLSGIAFVATMLGVVSIEGEETPEGAGADEVLAHWADQSDTRLVMTTLAALAIVFLVTFTASLRGALRSREHAEASASAVAFGGGLLTAAGIGFSAMVSLSAARAGDEGEASVVVPLDHLAQSNWVLVTAGMAVLMLASGSGALMTGALPRILAWSALVLGLALVTPAGFFGFMLSPLWIIAVSIVLYRRQGQSRDA